MEFKQMKGGMAKLGDKLGSILINSLAPNQRIPRQRLKMLAVTNPSIPTN